MTTAPKTNWLATYNNPPKEVLESPEEWLRAMHTSSKAVYTNGQLERGSGEGTLHFQFFMNFKKPGKRLSGMKAIQPQAKISYHQVSRDNGASDYCLKEDTR